MGAQERARSAIESEDQDVSKDASWQAFHGLNGEMVGAHHDEDGVMLRADFHGSKLSASTARELAHHLSACADQADDWMLAATGPGPVSPSPWGHPEPLREDDPDEPVNREIEPEPADWHDGPDLIAPDEPDEPEPEDYDPGPEVDDQGGMSEYWPHAI